MSAISVFLSRPTSVNPAQQAFCESLSDVLDGEGLQARTLGVTDYPGSAPLGEVVTLMRQCSGAIALGLRQLHVKAGTRKEGSANQAEVNDLHLPTPWNQIEAGMAVALDRPLLVAREQGVEGGVFDLGSSDRFIHQVELNDGWLDAKRFRQPFSIWVDDVKKFDATLSHGPAQ